MLYRTRNDSVAKLGGYILSRLDRRLARFLFSLINHNNTVVKYKTKFKPNCQRSTLAGNYKYHININFHILVISISLVDKHMI